MSLTVLQGKVRTVATQLLSDKLDIWNMISNNTLVMGSTVQTKDLIESLSWGLISGLVSERNAFAPVGTAADVKVMAQLLANQVRLDGKVGPLAITTGMLQKLDTNMAEIAGVVAAQAAQGMIASFVKVGAGAAKAAISSQTSLVTTQMVHNYVPGTANAPAAGSKFPTLIDLELATLPFGDRMGDIRAWVMSGAQYIMFKAYDVIKNDKELFKIESVRVMEDASGRRFIVTDAAGLGDSVVGLTQAGVIVNASALSMESGTVLGGENIERVLQGEYSYDVAVKGYRLKSATTAIAGTKSFKQTDVMTTANWEVLKSAGVDNAPVTFDNVEGATIPTTAAPAKKRQQTAQTAVDWNLKETAGVILTLTATTATAQNAVV